MGSGLMELVLRPLTTDDVPTLVGLEKANQVAPWTEGIFRDELAADNRIYLAAEADGLVGFAGVLVVGDEAHVTNLLVSPEARGRGIGLRLMAGLVEAAIDAGACHLTLEVRSTNEAARRLYARLGLAPVGIRKGYYGDDDALILWAHDIDSAAFREKLEQLR